MQLTLQLSHCECWRPSNKTNGYCESSQTSGYFMKSSPTGYINGNLFQKYGEQFVNCLKEKHLLDLKRIMVLLDLHKPHLFNYNFMQLMIKSNIEVCGFPPSCTHMIQPLDDVPFGNFKRVYQRELLYMSRQLCGNRMGKSPDSCSRGGA